LLLPHFEQGNRFQSIQLDYDWNHVPSGNNAHCKQDLGGILVCPSSPVVQANRQATDYIAAIRVDTFGTRLEELVTSQRLDAKGGVGEDHRKWQGMLQLDFLNANNSSLSKRRRVRPAHVIDGLSRTWMYYEAVGKPFVFGLFQGSGDAEPRLYTGEERRSDNSLFRWASWQTWMTINDYCGEGQLINCNNVNKPFGFHPGGIFIASADGHVAFYEEGLDPNVFVAQVTMAGREW
jgi:hypothetical protein